MATNAVIPATGRNETLPSVTLDLFGPWNAEAAPAGWATLKNDGVTVSNCMADFLADLKYGNVGMPRLRALYKEGYNKVLVMKGVHQDEHIQSRITGRGEYVCHITIWLQRTYSDRKSVHVYINRNGTFCGATFWLPGQVRGQGEWVS
jgi:hypothetical protein